MSEKGLVTNKKNKIIACFYVFLAVTLVTSFIYIDSTYVCDDFYPTKECEKPGAIDPDTVRLTFEPEAGKDWVRPTLQFANPKLNEIEIEAEYDVGKKALFNTMADVENYPLILPGNILSVVIIEQKPNEILAEETMLEQGIRVKLLAKHTIIPYETHTIEIMGGDAEGTKIIQTLTGDESSTKLSTKIQLELKGLLGPLYFFPKSNFSHAMNTVNTSFVEYAKGYDSPYNKIVDELYREILLRPADLQAYNFWAPLLESGIITKDDLKNKLLNTDEKKHVDMVKYSDEEIIAMMSDSDIQIIDSMYREIMHRPVDIKGLVYWGGLLEFGLIDMEEMRIQIQNSPEAGEKINDEIRMEQIMEELRKLEEKSLVLCEVNQIYCLENWKFEEEELLLELQVYKKFEDMVNNNYFEVFDKWPDMEVKLHYTKLLFFRVMDTQALHDEFADPDSVQTCIFDDAVQVTWRTPNDEEICTFFHPNPTQIPPGWDKAAALRYWTEPQP